MPWLAAICGCPSVRRRCAARSAPSVASATPDAPRTVRSVQECPGLPSHDGPSAVVQTGDCRCCAARHAAASHSADARSAPRLPVQGLRCRQSALLRSTALDHGQSLQRSVGRAAFSIGFAPHPPMRRCCAMQTDARSASTPRSWHGRTTTRRCSAMRPSVKAFPCPTPRSCGPSWTPSRAVWYAPRRRPVAMAARPTAPLRPGRRYLYSV